MSTLWIDSAKLAHNAIQIRRLAETKGIESVWPVVKVFAGDVRAAKLMEDLGFSHVADSRIDNLRKFRRLAIKKVLLRIAAISEVLQVVRWADVSLQSELETIRALSDAAVKEDKTHEIVLMVDVGDLREGIWADAFDQDVVRTILTLPRIRLIGIGTNLTCYGGIVPDETNMKKLSDLATQIERVHGLRLSVVSGGNSSIFPYLKDHENLGRINSIRVGEAIVFGRETAYGTKIEGLFDDVVTLEAELIECLTKPSLPIGVSTMNSFGEATHFEDRGWIRRGIAAVGKQDVHPDYLIPVDDHVNILGGSSDHLIVELRDPSLKLGSRIAFRLTYPGLLMAATSPYVRKRWR